MKKRRQYPLRALHIAACAALVASLGAASSVWAAAAEPRANASDPRQLLRSSLVDDGVERAGEAAEGPAEGADEEADDAVGEPGAADNGSLEATQPEALFEQLLVVGVPEQARRVPGSAHVISKREVERQGYADIHRVLRQTPGLNVQEEDGYGLRPNIGIRGTGVERSQKITLLEDGVLIAPAPYSAPSAYYSPTAARMEGFEIRKGSGAIRQGPHTNGGAINYLSKSIPLALDARLSLTMGEEGLVRAGATLGDSSERFGWLLEGFHLETDGFKSIDGVAAGGTGFELDDFMGKFRLSSRPGAQTFQALELKLGKTDQVGNETYLGITQSDFDRSPFRRYASSAGDKITANHEQYQLSYYLQPSGRWNVTATLYRNDFFRNWFKLESVGGTRVADVLADPLEYPGLVSILRGESDSEAGALRVRNNRREYFSRGLQMVLAFQLEAGGVDHDVEIGLRRHQDQEDRFQEDDRYQMLDGRRVFTALGSPGSNANRVADAKATALFVRDTFTTGRWTWTPGARVEWIDLMRTDFGVMDPERTGESIKLRRNRLSAVIPGLGVGYELDRDSTLFFGVHKGFSPPSPSSTEEVDSEESINYELGWRYSNADRAAELVGFFNDYDNLLGNDTLSSGGQGTGNQFNGGEVEVKGLEAALTLNDLWRGSRRGMSLPLRLAYTYTEAQFRNSFESDFADWAPRVAKGDEVPYVPTGQLYAGLSLEAGRWGAHLDASYSEAMRTRPGTGAIAQNELIDSRLLLDLRVERRLSERGKVWVQVLNLTDELYVAARRPAGLRPGRPRAALVGASFGFNPSTGPGQ